MLMLLAAFSEFDTRGLQNASTNLPVNFDQIYDLPVHPSQSKHEVNKIENSTRVIIIVQQQLLFDM